MYARAQAPVGLIYTGGQATHPAVAPATHMPLAGLHTKPRLGERAGRVGRYSEQVFNGETDSATAALRLFRPGVSTLPVPLLAREVLADVMYLANSEHAYRIL